VGKAAEVDYLAQKAPVTERLDGIGRVFMNSLIDTVSLGKSREIWKYLAIAETCRALQLLQIWLLLSAPEPVLKIAAVEPLWGLTYRGLPVHR
jgi:hypothetical protein